MEEDNKNPKILIVEDDVKLGKTLSDVLKAKGYSPVAVLTGKEGVAAVKEGDISLALLDLKLPDISGIEVLKEIKKISPRTEVIILTAFASLDTATEAVNLGAFSYLQKPYDIEHLLLNIRRALERKWAEGELRTSAETYSDLCNRSPIAIVNVYKDYRVDCTDRLLEWTGWSREEMEHINLVKKSRFVNAFGNEVVLPPLIAAEMIEKTEKDYIPKLMRGETLEGVYQSYNRKDGGTVPLELNSVGYFGGKEPKPENFVHTICIFSNITERKKAEDRLQESKEKYMDLYENANDIIFTFDLQGRFTSANRAACIAFGYRKDEISKLTFSDVLLLEDAKLAWEKLQKGVAPKSDLIEEQPREYKAVRKDGSILDVEVRTRLIRENGKIAGVQGIARDVTERKRAEEEVKKYREFLATIIDNIPDTITIRDSQYRLVLVNQTYCNITGQTKEEAIGKTVYWKTDKEVFQTGKGLDIPEQTHTDLKGKRRYASVKKAPLTDESGEVSHVVTISRDITKRKAMEDAMLAAYKELETLDKLKTDFLNVAYHEMRSPLTPVVGYSSLLEQSQLSEKQKKYLRIINDGASQLDKLINRLLEVTRIEAEKVKLSLEEVSIAEIVNNLIERVKPQVDAKKQKIYTVVPGRDRG